MSNSSYRAVYRQDDDGTWLVHVPALDGCHSYGDSLSEAREHIRDAVILWTESTDVDITDVVEEAHPA